MNSTLNNQGIYESELITVLWQSDSTVFETSGIRNMSNHWFFKPQHHEHILPQVLLKWPSNRQFVSLPQPSIYTKVGKRILDVAISLWVIVFVLSWLIPIIGVLILLESPGPFLFIQRRSGRMGRPFYCFKFRTMSNSPQVRFQQTAKNDSRITAIGRFLRKTNLDEMPQFINVLLGDMSLVGPRPHAILHDAQYWSSAAYRERYWVRPGITGLAQIRGSRGETKGNKAMERRIRYDHLYIKRQTLLLDIKICLITLGLMTKGDVNAW